MKKIEIQNGEKNRLSKSGVHGNVKLNRQGLSTPNCFQIDFRKSHQVWGH